jgi:ABC-type transport system involved in multi-copper enzyme maturation permease subunit
MKTSWLTVGQLTIDTFRQARASGIFWMMLLVTAICVVLCASVRIIGDVPQRGGDGKDGPLLRLPPPVPIVIIPSVTAPLASTSPLESAVLATASGHTIWFDPAMNVQLRQGSGVETIGGRMTLAFGAISIPLGRERADAVRYLQLLLAGGVADTLGLLLALIWTAGFLPTALEASAASVLLAKPVPRWSLLLGKYTGVLVFVGFQALLFVGLTWFALGLRTGIWEMAYFWCVPLLLLQFAIFYSFSVLLAVATRSTVACVFGSLLFWLFGWGMNYGWVMLHASAQTMSPSGLFLADVAYWVSPKPIDLSLILFNTLGAPEYFDKPLVFKVMESGHLVSPELSILTSLLFTGVMLALAMHEFNSVDY